MKKTFKNLGIGWFLVDKGIVYSYLLLIDEMTGGAYGSRKPISKGDCKNIQETLDILIQNFMDKDNRSMLMKSALSDIANFITNNDGIMTGLTTEDSEQLHKMLRHGTEIFYGDYD